jgi:putative membrane protein insertion efficiency factor
MAGMLKKLLINVVKAYRLSLRPWLGVSCRFEPTCSTYSLISLERHGALQGTYLTLHRLSRCHPWCAGGLDPVPVNPPPFFNKVKAFFFK